MAKKTNQRGFSTLKNTLQLVVQLVGWLVGWLVCWCVGVLVCWCVGVLVCWCVGVLVCWLVGWLVGWCVGVLVVGWCVGVLVVGWLVGWLFGVLVQHGTKNKTLLETNRSQKKERLVSPAPLFRWYVSLMEGNIISDLFNLLKTFDALFHPFSSSF